MLAFALLRAFALRLLLGLCIAASFGVDTARGASALSPPARPSPGVLSGGEFAFWLAQAFDWSADSVSAPAALTQRGVPIATAADAARPVRTRQALDACEGAAHAAHYAIDENGRPSFRASLLTGLDCRDDSASLSRTEGRAMIANLRYPRLRILETTDFHGFILPPEARRGRRRVGGSVALAAWIERLRSENPQGTILVDGGDWFQGTMISNLQFGRPVVEQMNRLGYAAAAIGNHEFDWGLDTLAQRIAGLKFAALGANCLERASGERAPFARAETLVTRRGVRVGILGLCLRSSATATDPRNVETLRFADDSLTAARAVPQLRRAGADVVLVLGHLPIEGTSGHRYGDLARLARGVPGVDAWLGGHSHNRVIDEINGAPVMIAGAHGEVIGVCDLTVDPVGGRVVDRRLALVPVLTDSLPADSAFAARVAEWNAGVAPLAAVPVGMASRSLARTGDPSVGDLATDAMRDAAACDIAITNAGGLRTAIAAGPITRGTIYELMPFDDTIVTLELRGDQLRDLFEATLKTDRAPCASGAQLEYDPARPRLHRVVSLTHADGTAFEAGARYRIALNQFMAAGGDGFALPAGVGPASDTGTRVRDAIEAFVRRASADGGSLHYEPQGRVKRRAARP